MKQIGDRAMTPSRARFVITSAFLWGLLASDGRSEEWTQWGGAHRDFVVRDVALAAPWPKEGPRLLWKRPLGGGYSGVVADESGAYTLYHEGEEDVVVRIDRATGRTLWSYRYVEPFKGEGHGPGPHATPAIVGPRLFTLSAGGRLHALVKESGHVLWMRDLVAEFEAETPWHGFAGSPLPYDDMVIVPVGGTDGRGVMAFDQATGRVAWQNLAMVIGYSSPALIDVQGQPQAVFFAKNEIVGLDPCTGEKLWEVAQKAPPQHNATLMPVHAADGILWTSVRTMGEGDGSRAFRLSRDAAGTRAEELYANPRCAVEPYSNAVRIGDLIFTSNGYGRRARFVAVDAATGEVLWEKPGIGTVNSVGAGEWLMVLGEEGQLLLCRPDRRAPNVVSHTRFETERTWTGASLSGRHLFIRDGKEIQCLEVPVLPDATAQAPDRTAIPAIAGGAILLAAGLVLRRRRGRKFGPPHS